MRRLPFLYSAKSNIEKTVAKASAWAPLLH